MAKRRGQRSIVFKDKNCAIKNEGRTLFVVDVVTIEPKIRFTFLINRHANEVMGLVSFPCRALTAVTNAMEASVT